MNDLVILFILYYIILGYIRLVDAVELTSREKKR